MQTVLVFSALLACLAQAVNIVPVPGGKRGTGVTTRYWDCCKPSCAWAGNLNPAIARSPDRTCTKDGFTTIDPNAMSGCMQDGSGVAFTCNDHQPHVINGTLSIGFAGASFTGGADLSQCCSCFLLKFQGALTGKQMVVQVTNTGSDAVRNHFDIAIPGGGVGIFNGCALQWGAPANGWGDQYGGVHSIQECNQLPNPLQAGCKWRFTWFQGGDNPNVEFQQVVCPQEVLAISNCK